MKDPEPERADEPLPREGNGRSADSSPSETPDSSDPCELCGGRTEERHCKIVCLNCGYQRDCSDP
jgi:hypothetical protein